MSINTLAIISLVANFTLGLFTILGFFSTPRYERGGLGTLTVAVLPPLIASVLAMRILYQ